MALPGQFDHPAWTAAIGTFVTYAVIVGVMTILLFGIPYLLFSAL